jgi:predicted dehydrogenase
MSNRTRYAIVGVGARSEMYRDAILKTYPDSCQLVGLCDNNKGRLLNCQQWVQDMGVQVPGYDEKNFPKMISETSPDCVIVTTRDCFHENYICRAMEMDCDVITEKPMTTNEKKCKQILDTQKRTGKKCTVTFNYRYAPPRAQVKELLMSGVIGDVLSVDFHWMLDQEHGADYFRRWHRNKVNSGGLMVHKATHHFDLVNWWLSTIPVSVFAMGHREFYTPKMAERLGLKHRSDRCHGCPEISRCAFSLDMTTLKDLDRLYLNNEKHDGYYRDLCVFSDSIDIEDTMVVTVSYESGAKLSYSLNAFMPWEGYVVTFNGTKGRLEHKCEEQVYISGDGSIPGKLKKEGTWIKIYPLFDTAYNVDVWGGDGGHGGADPLMLEDIFQFKNLDDKYKRKADHRSGAYSILCGIAANYSIDTGKIINIKDLVPNIDQPNYTPMPSGETPIQMKKTVSKSWLHK